ncbi:Hypothetical_protein [Hexamita inflata]|uniref:Hypothetical_protein n=1 Tax=Hexamita inflata TaxID=28002 RepID=A0AA86PL20_9EUKA|nr:Hypothetical protein HINF_LOCUS28093 [Hexamita inflata]
MKANLKVNLEKVFSKVLNTFEITCESKVFLNKYYVTSKVQNTRHHYKPLQTKVKRAVYYDEVIRHHSHFSLFSPFLLTGSIIKLTQSSLLVKPPTISVNSSKPVCFGNRVQWPKLSEKTNIFHYISYYSIYCYQEQIFNHRTNSFLLRGY